MSDPLSVRPEPESAQSVVTPRSRTALVAGATGLVGGHCVASLLASDHYASVITAGRRPVDRSHPKLRQVTIDFTNLEAAGDLGADDVFCCLGTTIRKAGSRDAFRQVDFEFPMALARTALGQGARRFLLVSSLGADPGSRTFYLRVKGELEAAIRALPFEAVLVFRPSLLLGQRHEFRLGERVGEVMMRSVSPLMVGRFRRLRPIPAAHVATAMVRWAPLELTGYRVFESDEIAEIASVADR